MNLQRRLLLTCGVMVALIQAASAHHSFAAVFDGKQTVEVAGVVREFRFVNPHAEMTLDVVQADGKQAVLTIEFDGRLNLVVGGWTPETIRAGESVKVTGNPARRNEERIWFLSLERADGTKLVRPFTETINAIDEQRRQRSR